MELKTCHLKIEDESVYVKYNQIWNRIKEMLGVKFHTEPIYDDSFIKTKVKNVVKLLKHCLVGMKFLKKVLNIVV